MPWVLYLVYSVFWRRRQRNKAWEALGERLGLDYRPPSIIGSYRKLEGAYKGKPVFIEVIYYGGTNDRDTYTKYGRKLDERWRADVELATFKSKLFKRKPDGYRTGDPSFDDKYEIFGKITEDVEAVILHEDVRRELEQLSEHYASFWIEERWLWVEHRRVANDDQRMEETLERMIALDQAITAALDAHGGAQGPASREPEVMGVEEAPSGGVGW